MTTEKDPLLPALTVHSRSASRRPLGRHLLGPPSARRAVSWLPLRRFAEPWGASLATLLALTASACVSFTCDETLTCEEASGGAGGAPADDAELGVSPRDHAPSACVDGYERASTGCVDIDECALGTHTCSREPAVTCTNTPGGFSCGECPRGHEGRGDEPDGCLLVAPVVVSTSPTQGERGVSADAHIVVEFSEPMDAASTEAAFSSPSAALAGATFSWNTELTRLTITPAAPFSYQNVESVHAPAELIEFTLDVSARDADGDHLLEVVSVSFSPKRRFTETFEIDAPASGSVNWFSGDGIHTGTADIYASGTFDGRTARGFFSYDLSSVPEGAIVESATLAASLSGRICVYPGTGWPGIEIGLARVRHDGTGFATATMSELAAIYDAPVEEAFATKRSSAGTLQLSVVGGVGRFLSDRTDSAESLEYRIHGTGQTQCGSAALNAAPLTLVYLTE